MKTGQGGGGRGGSKKQSGHGRSGGGKKKQTSGGARKRRNSLEMEDTDGGTTAKRTYRKKSQVEKDIINQAAERGLAAMAKNGGKMPNGWYPAEFGRVKSDLTAAGAMVQFTYHDIENRVRAIRAERKKAAVAASSTTVRAQSTAATESTSGISLLPTRSQHVVSSAETSTSAETETTTPQESAPAMPFNRGGSQAQPSRTESIVAQVTAQVLEVIPNRCSLPCCGVPTFMVPLDCSTANCIEKVHPGCYFYYAQLNSVANPSEDFKCYDCLRQSLPGSFKGPCCWGLCKMPIEATQTCEGEGCSAVVHRLCVPANTATEGRLLCPACFQQYSSPALDIASSTAVPAVARAPVAAAAAATSGQVAAESNSSDAAAVSSLASSSENEPSSGSETSQQPNKGGRPKGSTKAAKRENTMLKKEATNLVRDASMSLWHKQNTIP